MLVTYFVNVMELNDHLFGKELFIRFTANAFRKLLSIYVFSYFPFGFEGRMWDLIVSVPDHCLSFYFTLLQYKYFGVEKFSYGPLVHACTTSHLQQNETAITRKRPCVCRLAEQNIERHQEQEASPLSDQ